MAGAAVKNLLIRAGADFSGLDKATKKSAIGIRNMGSAASAAGKLIKNALSAVGVVASLGAVVSAAKECKAAFDAQSESEARLAQTMKNMMGATAQDVQTIKDLTRAQQALGVVGDEVQLAGAQELATYLEERESLEKLIPVLNDMVTQQYGYVASAEAAQNIATMLGKVMEGQTGGLRRYGYYFDEAQEAVLKFGTEAERAAMLAEVVEGAVGGMNQALAQTPTGQIQQVKNQLGDIKESFGQATTTLLVGFLPAIRTALNWLSGLANMANRVAQSFANVFGGKYSPTETMVSFGGASDDAAEAVTDLGYSTVSAAKKVKNAMAGFDTLQILSWKDSGAGSAAASSGSGGVSIGTTSLASSLVETGGAGESVKWLEEKLQYIRDALGRLDTGKLGHIRDTIGRIFDDIDTGTKGPIRRLIDAGIEDFIRRCNISIESTDKLLSALAFFIEGDCSTAWGILRGDLDSAGRQMTEFSETVLRGSDDIDRTFHGVGRSGRDADDDLSRSFSHASGSISASMAGASDSAGSFAESVSGAFAAADSTATSRSWSIANAVSRVVQALSQISGGGSTFASIYSALVGGGVPFFADGGVPELGTLFWAGEAGPEIVAQVGGHNTVYNMTDLAEANEPVVAAIGQLANLVIAEMRQMDVSPVVTIGDRDVYRASERGRRAVGAALVTG